MKFIQTFIDRPVATTLLTIGIALAGSIGFKLLPVASLPQVDFPTISISASVSGASPETMAATVATPLERALGRIAGITEMTSASSLGSTRITLQFDLSRDINGAARDVQAAINAARSLLPSSLTGNPTYRKVNPSETPILVLAMTSNTVSKGAMYDAATSILAQKITQLDGVGDVTVGGGALPAVRVELDPAKLNSRGIPLEKVRTAIASTNVNQAKGFVEDDGRHWQVMANDQAMTAKEYLPLIISYHNGAPVRLADVGEAVDSVVDVRNSASSNGQPAILLTITRQPGANIIETVDHIRAMLPSLQASVPKGVTLGVAVDRSVMIRTSVHDVEFSLMLSIALVIMVVFVFLRDFRATLIPAVAVPVSLIGTFAVMYIAGYSLNNLTLMALTIATGFVVDDAIVVMENISRHIEKGVPRFKAAILGAKEVGFTVISMSISLVAVFIPILLMGGVVGRLFREFAITLSVAIGMSLVVSLSTTPMMCARVLRAQHVPAKPGSWSARIKGMLDRLMAGYGRTLTWALRHSLVMMGILAVTVALNVYLYIIIPKGFFPQQDNGLILGNIQADQSISFQAMKIKMDRVAAILREDPAVQTVTTSSERGNVASLNISLKPFAERKMSVDAVIGRLRVQVAHVAGVQVFMRPSQDLRVGARGGNGLYQFTIQADHLTDLRVWDPKIRLALSQLPELSDLNADSQDKGLQTTLVLDRDKIASLGLTVAEVDATLYDAFGQRQVSTLYKPLNQYKVVMELAPEYWQDPTALQKINVITAGGAKIPLSAIARYEPTNTALAVNHQGQFVATTMSFNLSPGVSLSQASAAINKTMADLGVPTSIQGGFQGTAKVFEESLRNQPLLILAALVAIYIVLGMLYESYIHPITIISTLPSAGVGALLALMACGIEFSVISLIGVLLLVGIVKKNAIMMIDCALEIERREGIDAKSAIFKACLQRFRPIMMTTLAALLGALPLAIGLGAGSELRRPLGMAIVGGLVFSQVLTLYTTPVVYLYFDRFRAWSASLRRAPVLTPAPAVSPS
ncbi:MAG: multidrug efflux RND transporter permease subunit [Verrucomicrobia bacterium]|nr:multidrug efflux RND transporter permease subunit [Verrucomicrobiota bacterium]